MYGLRVRDDRRGRLHDAFDAADTHQQSHGDAPAEHFVNLELNGASR